MTISDWLAKSTRQLTEAAIPTPSLDAALLLAEVLRTSRSYLIAHSNDVLDKEAVSLANSFLQQRLGRTPVAYITGKKEFYGREFVVTPDVLIPRPETEDLVDTAKSLLPSDARILDVGTGSGAIGITLKLEMPAAHVTVSDIAEEALMVARKNAKSNAARPLRYVQSDLLSHWLSHENPKLFDAILANLPYVDRAWKTSPETKFEPENALYADDSGLQLIKKLIIQSQRLIRLKGRLLLEADPEQHPVIIQYAQERGFRHEKTQGYALSFLRQA